MQDPMYPAGCSDNDPYFDDNSEPLLADDDGSERCESCLNFIDPEVCWCGEAVGQHHMGSGHSPIEMGCVCHYAQPPEPDGIDIRTDAELRGTPWPSSALEAASYEYEIAHW